MDRAYDYLIVGGGVSADAAARGIRTEDTDGSILIVSADVDAPYDRPPLSKGAWTDPDFTADQLPLKTAEETGAEVVTGEPVAEVHPVTHHVTTGSGRAIGYGELLLATGGTPRTLPGLPAGERVFAYRSADDYRRLRARVTPGTTVVVIGGGFIGTELAGSLSKVGATVTLVTPDPILAAKTLGPQLGAELGRRYGKALDLRTGRRVTAGTADDAGVGVTLDDGTQVHADLAVLGLGITPNQQLAADAGIGVNDGVEVDAQLRTSAPHVWAAGDVAEYPDAILGRRRVEHVDHAQHSGRQAGRNMAGAGETYGYTPFFWSDLLDDGYEAIGRIDASLEIVADWHEPLAEGILYYLRPDGVPLGVLTWNTYGHVDAARELLAAGEPLDRANLPTLG